MMTYQFCVCEYQHPVLFLDYLLLCTPIAIVFSRLLYPLFSCCHKNECDDVVDGCRC